MLTYIRDLLIEVAFSGVIIFMVVALSWALVKDYNQETFKLPKAAWVCTKEEQELVASPIFNGKALIMVNTPVMRCIQYTKK